jgi:hypothetical protein
VLAVGGPLLQPIPVKGAGGPGPSAPSDNGALPNPLPTPIPELDRFEHHNVPAGPYAEPSQIFDFNGVVAAAVLAGTGRDHKGRVVKFGGPGTDLRFMQGEYVTADGMHHHGTFLRI